jgi:hypothetical protein
MFLVGPAQRGSGRPDEFSMDYLSYAPVLLELGDKPGYERLRESAIAKMGGSNELIVAERILLACLLLPYEDEQLPTFDKWAQVDITLNQGCWACAALALLEHRRGRYDEALNWCNKSLNTGLEPQLGVTPAKREGSNTPLTCAVRAHIIRAMSYAELQQVETARAALANYPDMIESKFRGEFGMGTYESGFWKDWLIDRILLREALVLIKKSDQMTKPRQAADSDSPAEKREKTTED